MGCDNIANLAHVVPKISIHAPAWGATLRKTIGGIGLAISIHAPAWGATKAF